MDPPAASVPPDPPPSAPTLALAGILVLMVVYTLYFARDVAVPIVLAVMGAVLLAPLVRRLKRLGLPNPAGAALVVGGLIGVAALAFYTLSAPAYDWIDRAPQVLAQIERKVEQIRRPMREVQQATRKVEELAKGGGEAPQVVVADGHLGQLFVTGTGQVVTKTVVVLVLLLFLLAAGDTYMRRLVKVLSTGGGKRRAVEITRAVQRDVSTYLATVTLINAGLGLATALAMAVIGMPNPALWGAVVLVVNFVPYAGALFMVAVLSVVAVLTFDHLGHALLAPGAYFLLSAIEANLLTPTLLGRRLTLDPAVVFASLIAWAWLWGIPGAFLAVPLLVVFKAFCEHVEALSGIAVILGRRDEE